MKHRFLILSLVLASALLSGCGASRNIPVQTVREVSHDTLYLNHIQYDSVYVDNWQMTDRSEDTVYLEKSHVEYRYKLLRDTVHIVQIDSIPVITTVVERIETRYTPAIYKWSLGICITLILLIILYVVWKIKF